MLTGLAQLLPHRRLRLFFILPGTLSRRDRDLVAERWPSLHDQPDRPGIAEGTTVLVLRPTKENPRWECRHIHGALATMDTAIAFFSVWPIS